MIWGRRSKPELYQREQGFERCEVAERGEVVEAVILAPIAVTLIMLIVQAALIFHGRSILSAAVQDATKAAQVEGGSERAGMSAADQILQDSDGLLQVSSIVVDQKGDTVTSTAKAKVQSLVPYWNPTVSASSVGPIEAFRSETER